MSDSTQATDPARRVERARHAGMGPRRQNGPTRQNAHPSKTGRPAQPARNRGPSEAPPWRYRRRVTASPSTWTRLVLAAVLPVAVSAVWIPVRDRLPDTDLALLLVLVIGTIGWMLGARAALISAVTAAMAFDV